MDLARVQRIRKLIIIALFSDDEFMEMLVLKGGNAIDLIHGVALRGSIDLDFSLESDFAEKDDQVLRSRFERLLNVTFRPEGLRAFDVTFVSVPPSLSAEMKSFWGGYRLEFKVIDAREFDTRKGDSRKLRVAAESIAPGHRKRFCVDISRHEYCRPKQEHDLDGYTIYVYTPEMIVCEKIRAICQQMPEYARSVKSPSRSARARDFFDICTLVEHYTLDLTADTNRDLIRRMFETKRVPLDLLRRISDHREYHRSDFASVEATVKPGIRLREFDYYFDYVVGLVQALEPFGDE